MRHCPRQTFAGAMPRAVSRVIAGEKLPQAGALPRKKRELPQTSVALSARRAHVTWSSVVSSCPISPSRCSRGICVAHAQGRRDPSFSGNVRTARTPKTRDITGASDPPPMNRAISRAAECSKRGYSAAAAAFGARRRVQENGGRMNYLRRDAVFFTRCAVCSRVGDRTIRSAAAYSSHAMPPRCRQRAAPSRAHRAPLSLSRKLDHRAGEGGEAANAACTKDRRGIATALDLALPASVTAREVPLRSSHPSGGAPARGDY